MSLVPGSNRLVVAGAGDVSGAIEINSMLAPDLDYS